MALTIVETPGATDANSFVTAAEMTAYCDARLNASAWTADTAQLPALVEATRDLSLLQYKGGRASATQALSWPRIWAEDPDASQAYEDPSLPHFVVGSIAVYYAGDEIPQRVKDATCELALQYLKAGTSDVAALDDTIGIIRERVDVLETEYAAPSMRAQGLARFPRVMAYVAPLLVASGGITMVRT